jgi:DEAD/DEAH box helicase domain-containing protein
MSSRKTPLVTAEEDDLVHCLQIVDPLLQFLTRATSNPFITLQCLQGTVAGVAQTAILSHIPELARRGILHLSKKDTNTTSVTATTAYDDDVTSDAKLCPPDYYDWFSSTNPENVIIGFPPPLTVSSSSSSEDDHDEKKKQKQKQNPKRSKASRQNKGLSGSTKLAAKRRMAALRRSLKKHPFTLHSANCDTLVSTNNNDTTNHQLQESIMMVGSSSNVSKGPIYTAEDQETCHQQQQNHALEQLSSLIQAEKIPKTLLDIHDNHDTTKVSSNSSWIIPQQAAYAGFHQKRPLRTKSLTPTTLKLIPTSLLKAFSLCYEDEHDVDQQHQYQQYQQSGKDRQLYCHQVDAIEAAFSRIPTIVCTSTGSGKSLCYLLPVLTSAMTTSSTSLLIFPTKALAQDQFTKIQKIIQHDNHHYKDLSDKIQVATIDGDMTCHATRSRVAEQCNVILTNPDTLHASILPNWKKNRAYCKLLANIRYIVVDEAHIYEGTFGAHVSLIFARLIRLCHAASLTLSTSTQEQSFSTPPTFLASSATIEHPEIHFRLLCRIPDQTTVKVLLPSDDGSPW